VHREVDVDRLDRVVPVVVLRRGEEVPDRAEAPAHVGVDQHGLERHEEHVGEDRPRGEAQHVERHEREAAGHHDVHQVQAGAGQPVHLPARVVDRVEPPEPGHLVEEPVHRVLGEIGDDQHLDELQRQRLRGHRGLELRRHRPAEEDCGGRHGQEHGELHEEMAHPEVPEIRAPLGAEDRLLAQPAEEQLDRHEDGGEQKEIE
jgi:hypothetical protein